MAKISDSIVAQAKDFKPEMKITINVAAASDKDKVKAYKTASWKHNNEAQSSDPAEAGSTPRPKRIMRMDDLLNQV